MREKRLILCIGNQPMQQLRAKRLQEKWCSKPGREKSDCQVLIIDTSDPLAIPQSFKQLVSSAEHEIAILGHGTHHGNSKLYDEEYRAVSLYDIASLIALLTNKHHLGSSGKPAIQISLISCYGAYKKNRKTLSAAEYLQTALLSLNLRSDITARRSFIVVEISGRKTTAAFPDRDKVIAAYDRALQLPASDQSAITDCQNNISRLIPKSKMEAHGPASKVTFRIREGTTSNLFQTEIRHSKPSEIQAQRSCHVLNLIDQLWDEYLKIYSVSEDQTNCIDAIRNDLKHRRFSSYDCITLMIKGHENVYESRQLVPKFLRLYDSFPSVLSNLTKQVSELMELVERRPSRDALITCPDSFK
ncbi:MAG: C80 family cysteine peptidase [Coxiellaceae bacterium]|nr:C80 family cysteine peptidase [Coxiellaceae bacterium]